MDLSYFPGCTLKTKTRYFEETAIASLEKLGVRLVELPRWNCCGAAYSQPEDDLIHQAAPVRNLVRAQEEGAEKLVTLCSFCYNTLKRAHALVGGDEEKLNTLNRFMDEEADYRGRVQPVHMLEVLKHDIGWEAVAAKTLKRLEGLSVACYYGCTLLRPRAVALDDVEHPTIMQDLMKALGARVAEFPFAAECCGSYLSVSNPDGVTDRVWRILSSARTAGADVVAIVCPLCEYNLGARQPAVKQQHREFQDMPVVYFTQLLALALGVDGGACGFDSGFAPAKALLAEKGYM